MSVAHHGRCVAAPLPACRQPLCRCATSGVCTREDTLCRCATSGVCTREDRCRGKDFVGACGNIQSLTDTAALPPGGDFRVGCRPPHVWGARPGGEPAQRGNSVPASLLGGLGLLGLVGLAIFLEKRKVSLLKGAQGRGVRSVAVAHQEVFCWLQQSCTGPRDLLTSLVGYRCRRARPSGYNSEEKT